MFVFIVGPVDCEWGEWAIYGMCSATCGEGTYSKSRFKAVIEKNGGTCIGDDTVTEQCSNLPGCPGTLCSINIQIQGYQCKRSIK